MTRARLPGEVRFSPNEHMQFSWSKMLLDVPSGGPQKTSEDENSNPRGEYNHAFTLLVILTSQIPLPHPRPL